MAQSLESRVEKASTSPFKWAYTDAIRYGEDKLMEMGLTFENAKMLMQRIAEEFPYKGVGDLDETSNTR